MLKTSILLLFLTLSHAQASNLKNIIDSMSDQLTQKKISTFISNQTKAVVFFNYLTGCPLVKKYMTVIPELNKKYLGKVLFVIVDSSLAAEADKSKTIASLRKNKSLFPFAIDKGSRLERLTQLSVATEVVVVNPQDYKILYRGAVDDQFGLNFDRPLPNNNYLDEVLSAAVANSPKKYFETEAQGCVITLAPQTNE